jgi:hypothetical protein
MERILRRGARLYLVFGDEDVERWGEFERARAGTLGDIMETAPELVEVSKVGGTITDIQDVTAQDEIIDLVADWAVRSAGIQISG